jgi:hypothetical protein
MLFDEEKSLLLIAVAFSITEYLEIKGKTDDQ